MIDEQRELYEATVFLFKELIKNTPFYYIKSGVVKSVDGNKAVVIIDKEESVCGIASGLPVYPDDIVKIVVNQSNYSDKNILYKLMRVDETVPPNDGDILDAIAKKHAPETVDGYTYYTGSSPPTSPGHFSRWLDTSVSGKPVLKINVGTESNPNWVGLNVSYLQGKEPNDFLNVSTGANLPSAGESYRGKFFSLPGGQGVADKLYICIKTDTNNYAWKLVNLTDP